VQPIPELFRNPTAEQRADSRHNIQEIKWL
jgi:hypothetical protein